MRILSQLVILPGLLYSSLCGGQPTKLDYQVNPEYQNLIGSSQGAIPVPSYPQASNSLVFGGIFSLTDSSVNNTIIANGVEEALAMQCAIEDLNELFSRQNVSIRFYYQIINDQNVVSSAVRAAVQLIESGVPVIIGTSTSNSALQVATLASGYDIPMLSSSATADSLSDNLVYSSFFRMVPSDVFIAQAIAATMDFFNWTLVSTVYSVTSFGQSGQRQFLNQAQLHNINITCVTAIPEGDVSLVPAIANCLSSSQARVVMLWMNIEDAGNVIDILYDTPSLRDLLFILPGYWTDFPDFEALSRGRFPVSYIKGSILVTPRSGNIKDFLKCLSNMVPRKTTVNPLFANYFEKVLRCSLDLSLPVCDPIIRFRAVGPNYNCSCAEEEALRFHVPLTTVNYIYDSIQAVANALYQLNGNCTGLEDATGIPFCSKNTFTPSEITNIIRISQFDGRTGRIGFNSQNNPITADLDISQIVDGGDIKKVGYYLPTAFYINTTLLTWKDGKSPESAIIPQEISIDSDAIAWVSVIFSSLAIAVGLYLMAFFIWNRKNAVVRQISPTFTILMLLGIIMCLTSQVLWAITQNKALCTLKVWLLAVGFGLIMGNLLAKTYRIYRIFQDSRAKTVVVRDKDLFRVVGTVLFIEVLFLSLYTFPSGLPKPVILQSQSDELLLYVQCRVSSSFLQTAGIICLELFNFFLVVAAVILAYLTRHVDSDFNESRDIGYVVYMYMLVSIILVPLYYTAGDSFSSLSRQFIFRSITVILTMYITLFVLIFPKIFTVIAVNRIEEEIKRKEEEKKERRYENIGIPGAEVGEDFAFTQTLNNRKSLYEFETMVNIMEESDDAGDGALDRYYPGQKTEKPEETAEDLHFKKLYVNTLRKR